MMLLTSPSLHQFYLASLATRGASRGASFAGRFTSSRYRLRFATARNRYPAQATIGRVPFASESATTGMVEAGKSAAGRGRVEPGRAAAGSPAVVASSTSGEAPVEPPPFAVVHNGRLLTNHVTRGDNTADGCTRWPSGPRAFLETMPKGAYTTTRTFGNGSHLLLWDFHLDRVTRSLRLLAKAHPDLFPNLPPNLLSTRHQEQEEEESLEEFQKKADQIRDLVLDLRKDIRASVFAAVQEMVGCDWWRRNVQGEQNGEICLMILLCGQEALLGEGPTDSTASMGEETAEESAAHARRVEVYVHASTVHPSNPFSSHSLPPPVCAAVMGPGRHTPLAKFSSWPLVRRALEAARPAEARDVILSNDGNALLEGITSNLFLVARTEPACESNSSRGSPWHGFELQTASLESGILPGSIRQAIIDTCNERGIPLQMKTPQWSERALWVEAFVTNALSIVQPVGSILMPATWPSEITYDSWQSVDKWLTWQAPAIEDAVDSHSAILLGHVVDYMISRSAKADALLTSDDPSVTIPRSSYFPVWQIFSLIFQNPPPLPPNPVQHPKEKYHPLGSARIALLGLQRVRVVVVPLGRGRPGLQPKDPCSRRSLMGRSGRGRWRKGAGKTQGQGGKQGEGPGDEQRKGQGNGQEHGHGVDQGDVVASTGRDGRLVVVTAVGEKGVESGGELGEGEGSEGEVIEGEKCEENGVEREGSKVGETREAVLDEKQGGEKANGATTGDSSSYLSFDLLPFAAADGADSDDGAGVFGGDYDAEGSSEDRGGGVCSQDNTEFGINELASTACGDDFSATYLVRTITPLIPWQFGCMSTIEAVVYALQILEPDNRVKLDQLLEVFNSMVIDQVEGMRRNGKSSLIPDDWIAPGKITTIV
ncbi:unnamed protein product [Closterium sp. Yama58-4]|nr:unnamed protein product [Closterium sp. Yama58-4]